VRILPSVKAAAILSASLSLILLAPAQAASARALDPVGASAVKPASHGMATYLSPALTSSGRRTVAVSIATDGRIMYDWWDLGGGAHGWREVPGNGRTNAAAAAAAVSDGTYVFIVIKGLDGNVYLNQGTPGGSFVGWQALGIRTNVAPSAASSGNTTTVAVTGTDGRIYFDWWEFGGGGHGFREVPGGVRTDTTTASSLFIGNVIYLLARGLDGVVYQTWGYTDGRFQPWQSMGITTNVAPAMSSGGDITGNYTVGVVTGTDGRVYYDWWDAITYRHGWREMPGGGYTNAAPAAAWVHDANYVFVMIKGLDNTMYLNQGSPGGSFVGWR
jgi:hypothetical protein